MNIQLLDAIARWLEGGAKHERIEFDMAKGVYVATGDDLEPTEDELTRCQTSCCIAGAALTFSHKDDVGYLHEILEGGESDYDYARGQGMGWQAPWWKVRSEAQELLELSHSDAEKLFTPDLHMGGDLSDFDAAWAARTIRHLIDTGTVDWEATRHETESA